jgi:ubiquinone/menaquinone biosynthesis C-methylase UbiE
MIFTNLIARQFRKPSGLLAWYAAGFMKRSNTPCIEWAITKCNIQPSDTVLEIGFGPGIGITMAAEKLETGKLYGLDFSSAMFKTAMRRNKQLIKRGRVELVCGPLFPAPFADNFFNSVFGVNIIYFWPKPENELSGIQRMLKPGGIAVFFLSDKYSLNKIPCTKTDIFRKYTADEFIQLLAKCGFESIDVETRKDLRGGLEMTGHCVSAQKSAA